MKVAIPTVLRGMNLKGVLEEDERIRQKRTLLTMMLHSGSAMMAMGIAIAVLGTPDRLWGFLAIAAGVMIWLRVYRRLAEVSRELAERNP